jgi:uncharacterized membrane protein
MSETYKRTIVRTISYRIVALLITAIWTGLSDAILIHIILTAVHYIFERFWLKIKWGKIDS